MKTPTPPSPEQQQQLCDEWNDENPVGTSVKVTLDNGTVHRTKTKSDAQLMGGHTAVVWLEDIAGAYTLSRVTAVADPFALAKDAIAYVLRRIQEDENIRYHMGAGTEAFARLKKAYSEVYGMPEKEVEKQVFSRTTTRKAAAERMDDIRDIIDRLNIRLDPELAEAVALKEITALCRG